MGPRTALHPPASFSCDSENRVPSRANVAYDKDTKPSKVLSASS
jgi:hypothetical protein